MKNYLCAYWFVCRTLTWRPRSATKKIQNKLQIPKRSRKKIAKNKGVVRDFSPAPAIKHSGVVITNKHRYRVNHMLQINFDKRGRAGNNVFIEK